MSTTRSGYDVAIVLAEYVFQNPGQMRSVVQNNLERKLTLIEFNIAEDILKDTGIIYGGIHETKNIAGKDVFGYCYFPDQERTLDSVIKYLQSHSKN